MTYYYGSYTRKYEWTAFTESALVGSGNLGCGSTFTMPTHASVCMSTYDNDSFLSGDEYCDERASDTTGQQAYINGAPVGAKLYAECYHVLKGSDGKTYYLIEIEIEGYNGWCDKDFFTFYGAVPPAGVKLSVVNTCSVSGNMIDYNCLANCSLAPPNTPPTFSNAPANCITVNENTTFVIDLDATDKDGDTLTYSIAGGADAAFFSIDAATGKLSFKTAPDYENPADSGKDNIYEVQVKVADGKGGEEVRALKVCVADVAENSCIVVEAETMSLCGYSVERRTDASGGADIMLCASSGWASTCFNGPSGTYDVSLTYMDESDGRGKLAIYVNGKLIRTVDLNKDNNGDGTVGKSSWSTLTIDDLQLAKGDVIKIVGVGNCGEFARIDKIQFCKDAGPLLGKIGDRVWLDANGDGRQDADEKGMAGVTVRLLDAATGKEIASQTTDANGNYLFEGVPAGSYKVAFDLPAGHAFTTPDAGGDDTRDSDVLAGGQTGTITLAAGQANLTVDAGLVELPGSLSGRYFLDANGNDIDDSEPGIAGVTVELIGASGEVLKATTTAADGSYSFTGLAAGSYNVRFTDKVSGLVLVQQDAGDDDQIDSDAEDRGNGVSEITDILVTAGRNTPDNDAGVKDPRTGAIGDRVWLDTNRNGIQDGDETGVEGVKVTLIGAGADGKLGTDDDTRTTAFTNAEGRYLFSGLAAGLYMVEFAQADTFDFTLRDAGSDDAADSDVGANGLTGPITLGVGETNETIDAGLVQRNRAPEAAADSGKGCADTAVTVDVLKNDSDPDGDALTIVAINGQAIAEGQTIQTAAGGVTLSGGVLKVLGNDAAAVAALDIGQKGQFSFSYTVSDGKGAMADATVTMDYCGDANSVESLVNSFPKLVSYQIVSGLRQNPLSPSAYDLKISGTGDAHLDGTIFEQAYCLSFLDPAAAGADFSTAPELTGSLFGAQTAAGLGVFNPGQKSSFNGQTAADNMDLINWIIAQDFEHKSAGSVDGGFNGWEVQFAIWELTDQFNSASAFQKNAAYGSLEDTRYILQQAQLYGNDFQAKPGDIIGLVIDPGTTEPENTQPFIVALDFERYDCLC